MHDTNNPQQARLTNANGTLSGDRGESVAPQDFSSKSGSMVSIADERIHCKASTRGKEREGDDCIYQGDASNSARWMHSNAMEEVREHCRPSTANKIEIQWAAVQIFKHNPLSLSQAHCCLPLDFSFPNNSATKQVEKVKLCQAWLPMKLLKPWGSHSEQGLCESMSSLWIAVCSAMCMLMKALFIVIIECYSAFHTNIKGIFYIFFSLQI